MTLREYQCSESGVMETTGEEQILISFHNGVCISKGPTDLEAGNHYMFIDYLANARCS